jgi:hypothetical protein
MAKDTRYLKETFSLFGRRPVLYVAATVLPGLSIPIIPLLVGRAIRPLLMVSGNAAPPNPIVMYQSMDWTARIGVILAFFLMASLAHAAIVSGISLLSWEECEGRALVALDLAAATFRRLLSLTVLAFIIVTGTFVGSLFLFIPGLWLASVTGFAIPAAAIEKLGPLRALKRGFRLTRGRRIELFAIYSLTFVVFFALRTVQDLIPLTSVFSLVIRLLVVVAIALTLGLFLSILLTLLYRQARTEHETTDMGCPAVSALADPNRPEVRAALEKSLAKEPGP